MSRKDDIRRIASFVGNSAAHVAIYREGAEKEVRTYTAIAAEIAERKTWNEREIAEFREKARRRAGSEIRRRMKEYGLDEKKFSDFLSVAGEFIERFIGEELTPKA